MSTPETTHHTTADITHHAKALLEATRDVAGDHITEARKRLATALENSKHMLESVKEKAVAGAKATDEAVRNHPWQAIGIAVAVGAVVGYFVSASCSCRRD